MKMVLSVLCYICFLSKEPDIALEAERIIAFETHIHGPYLSVKQVPFPFFQISGYWRFSRHIYG